MSEPLDPRLAKLMENAIERSQKIFDEQFRHSREITDHHIEGLRRKFRIFPCFPEKKPEQTEGRESKEEEA